jgi:GST-like protein
MPQIRPIELYYWSTPNGRKISIMLEEINVPYHVTFVDIGKDEQWTPEFGSISPNHQIPAIVDPNGPGGEPISVFESGAILLYLGRKYGKLLPKDERGRVAVEQWLIWQVASFGPFLGQAHHFNFSAKEEVPYAINRYHKIAERLYTVLDKQLATNDYVAGDYSIADIALYCWSASHKRQRIDFTDYPNVSRWFDAISGRPAVKRGMALVKPGHVTTTALPTPAWAQASATR